MDSVEKVNELRNVMKTEHKLTMEQETWCSDACYKRYLRAREGNVKEAGKLLAKTLTWRTSFQVDDLHKLDFTADIETGRMYVAGNDEAGHSVLITRKRADRISTNEHDKYLQYLVYNLETAVRAMEKGQEKWVWIMDLKGYSRANSPPLNVSMQTLHILADYYPERLEHVYVVDAPTIFFVLFKALSPFIHHVTRSKIIFIQGAEMQAKADRGEVPAEHARYYREDVSADQCKVNLQRWWSEQ